MKNSKILIFTFILILLAIGYIVSINADKPKVNNLPGDNNSQGKLNIDVVCTSALTYMTFENGEAADKFVSECKEGKHPDVIERYKQDMNLGDGATI